jgi:hypothetical protein
MTQIKKYDQLTPEIKKALEAEQIDDLQVGDIFIADSDSYNVGEIVRVIGFEHDKKYGVYVLYQSAVDWEGTEWSGRAMEYSDGTTKADPHDRSSLHDFKHYHVQRNHKLERGKTVKQYYDEALAVINGKISTDVYKAPTTGAVSDDRAIMHKGSKEALVALQNDLEQRKNQAELLRAFVGYEMERRKQELEKIKAAVYEIVADFQKKIERIMRVITTIELYLGIDEELFQIQDGPKASATEPIQFRQAVLYMDEEIGHWEEGGLDFTNISWFDEWLVKDNNFKRLLPEQKGMLVFRPRRYKKDYRTDNALYEAEMNRNNLNSTYLLIRNGECVYRVFSDKIVILPRLFPQRKELETLLKKTEEKLEKEWSAHSKQELKENVDDVFYQYKKRAALMQGLIDRSEVFQPMVKRISIYKLDECEGLVNFVYDDELTLPSGRLPFWEWVKQINEKITVGSRVLMTGHYDGGYYRRSDFSDRFYRNYREGNEPAAPSKGVYQVMNFQKVYTWKVRKLQYDKFIKENPDGTHIKKSFISNEHDTVEDYKLLQVKRNHYTYGADAIGHIDTMRYGVGDRDQYIIQFKQREQDLVVRYNPGDTVREGWSWNTHDRKNNISFKILPTDIFILNYDLIDLDDVNFYLGSRVDRPNYLDMMPVLESIREQRLKEIANEKEFIRFIVGRTAPKLGGNKGEALKRALECVRWWKYKNKWKRAIAKDDTLALRMIEQRLLSPNYATFKHHLNKE